VNSTIRFVEAPPRFRSGSLFPGPVFRDKVFDVPLVIDCLPFFDPSFMALDKTTSPVDLRRKCILLAGPSGTEEVKLVAV